MYNPAAVLPLFRVSEMTGYINVSGISPCSFYGLRKLRFLLGTKKMNDTPAACPASCRSALFLAYISRILVYFSNSLFKVSWMSWYSRARAVSLNYPLPPFYPEKYRKTAAMRIIYVVFINPTYICNMPLNATIQPAISLYLPYMQKATIHLAHISCS